LHALTQLAQVLKKTFTDFRERDPLGLAASSAFFTSFALPPLLIILIYIFGLVFNRHAIRDQLFEHLALVLGKDSAQTVQQTSRGFVHLAHNELVASLGFIFLMFVATTLFNQLSVSFNRLWNVQLHSKKGFLQILKPRLKSLAAIFFTGIVFLAHLKVESLQLWIFTNAGSPGSFKHIFFVIVSRGLSVIIISAWFASLFRFMASAHPDWRTAVAGGLLTGIFYSIGELILSRLLNANNIKMVFGYSGSFVGILLYVFYVSFILFYGWMFTRNLAVVYNKPIRLDKDAVEFVMTENRKPRA
jgi:membrane protein